MSSRSKMVQQPGMRSTGGRLPIGLSVQAMLKKGFESHRQGDLNKARELFVQALKRDRRNFDALHMLGVIAYQTKDPALAVEMIGRAIKEDSRKAAAYNNCGLALQDLKRFDEALKHYGRALKLKPDYALAHYNRGVTLRELSRFDEAVRSHDRALKLLPELAEAHHDRGLALQALQRLDEALASYDRALALRPEHALAWYSRGVTLRELQRLDDALDSYDRALRVRRDLAEAWCNRGHILHELRRYQEALSSHDMAVALRPALAEAHYNRGSTLQVMERFDEALVAYRAALELRPDYAACHANLSSCYLSTGAFTDGWKEYQWRPNQRKTGTADINQLHRKPLVGDLSGLHVVVECEQGLGDELFFLRFMPMLRDRGARATYIADSRLVGLLNRSGISDSVVALGENPGPWDLWLTLGDLPFVLGAGEDDIPPPFSIPPLAASRGELSERLRTFGPAPYLGLTWRAGTGNGTSGVLFREVPLDGFVRSMKAAGGSLVAVQRLPKPGEIAALEQAFGRPVLDLTDFNRDLEAMLALMGLLDFYVCVDNTNQHLRAATGRVSRVLVPSPPEFRWAARGEESPWFPGTRIYRQTLMGDWSAALERLAADMKRD